LYFHGGAKGVLAETALMIPVHIDRDNNHDQAEGDAAPADNLLAMFRKDFDAVLKFEDELIGFQFFAGKLLGHGTSGLEISV
jgi:hypothetical protein